MGRGPAETGIQGLDARAEVYDIQVESTFSLTPYGKVGASPLQLYPSTMKLFQAVTRDYDDYSFVSPMLRDVYGHAGEPDDQPTPLQFIQELVQVKNDRGRYLLTEPRVRSLTLDLVDDYAVNSGTLSGCRKRCTPGCGPCCPSRCPQETGTPRPSRPPSSW